MTKKENYLRALLIQDPEWVPMEFDDDVLKVIWRPIVERPAQAGKDAWGVEWDYDVDAEGGTYPAPRNYVISDIENWKEQVSLPDLDKGDWEGVKLQADAIDRDKYVIEGNVDMGIFERTYLLMGIEEALVAYYTNQEEMYELAGTIADYKIEFLHRFIETIKPDTIMYGDDWGTQNNLFMSPDIWRAIIKPHTQRIYDCIRSHGVIVKQHSCGRIESIFGDMIEMGVQGYNPCQPCNDLASLKKAYGDKICFCGGIDSQFVLTPPTKTPEDVRNEVIKRMTELKGEHGGYLCGPSHEVPYDSKKLEAMMSTIKQYGKYNR